MGGCAPIVAAHRFDSDGVRSDGEGQLFDELRRSGSLSGGEPTHSEYSGTKALMLAVLEDGIRCYLSPIASVQYEADHWMRARRQNWPFSFTSVCQVLGLDPSAVRVAVQRMQKNRLTPRRAIGRNRPNVRRGGRMTNPR